jgi:hypothetical protein
MKPIWLLILLSLLLIAPASAYYNVSYTDIAPGNLLNAKYTPGSGYLIGQVDIYDLDTPSNTTIVLTEPGGSGAYTVWYNTTALYGGATIKAQGAIQHPNGTVVTFDKTAFEPMFAFWGTAKTAITIQYYYVDTGLWIYLKFNVYPGSFFGEWRTQIGDVTWDWLNNAENIVAFGEVQAESTDTFNANIYYVTASELAGIESGDIIGQAASQIGSGAWATLLFIVSVIPVIGPALAIVVEYIGMLVSELVWLLDFIIVKNWMGTLILIEFLCISEALIYGQKKSNVQLMRRVASNHVAMFTALIMVIMFLYDNIILRTINALGSLLPG